MKKFILFFLMVLMGFTVRSQCPLYETLIREAKAKEATDFLAALHKYNTAQTYCREKSAEVQGMIVQMFLKIDSIKQLSAENEKKAKQSAAIAQRVRNAVYFYGDRFCLAGTVGNYFFINEQGFIVNEFGTWLRATQFDNIGLSKTLTITAQGGSNNHYLDTFGTVYDIYSSFANLRRAKRHNNALDLVTNIVEAIPEDISFSEVLILRMAEGWQRVCGPKISRFSNVRYLDANRCDLKSLDAGYYTLQNLSCLDLSYNDGLKLSDELGNLTNLTLLDVSRTGIENRPEDFPDISRKLIHLKTLSLSGTEADRKKITESFKHKVPPGCGINYIVIEE